MEGEEENNSMDLSLPNDNESCGEIYWGYSAATDNGTADKRAREVEEDEVEVEEEEDEWSEENWRSK